MRLPVLVLIPKEFCGFGVLSQNKRKTPPILQLNLNISLKCW